MPNTIIFTSNLLGCAIVFITSYWYGKSVILGETRPSLGALALFSLNTSLAAYHNEQVSSFITTMLIWVSALSNLSMFLITVIAGRWATFTKGDYFLGICAIVLVLIQLFIYLPAYGIVLACTIEAVGTAMVLHKMCAHPCKENISSWALVAVNYGINSGIQIYTVGIGVNALFSVFVFVNCLAIVLLGGWQHISQKYHA